MFHPHYTWLLFVHLRLEVWSYVWLTLLTWTEDAKAIGGGGSAVMIHLLETGLFFVIDPNGKRAALIRRGKGVRRWMTKAKRVGLVVANEREIMYGGWLKHASFVGHELLISFGHMIAEFAVMESSLFRELSNAGDRIV